MKIQRTIVVFDAPDLDVESSFWAGLLGGTVDKDDEDGWHSLMVDGEWRMGFQLAPNHVRPDWPDGEQQQMHMDIYIDSVDGLEAAHAEVMALGATLLKETERRDRDGFQVYASPAGHPFCICWMG